MTYHHSHCLEATKQRHAGHRVPFYHLLFVKFELDMAVHGAVHGVDDLTQDFSQTAAPDERASFPVGREGDVKVQILRFGESAG